MDATDRDRTFVGGRWIWLLLPFALGAVAACSSDSPSGLDAFDGLDNCDLNTSFVADGGVGRDGIPALTDPPMSTAGQSEGLAYLRDDDRVIGFMVDGQAYAVSHNILWWHEIVNLNVEGRQLAITLCPLTGTSLGFDRASIGGDELGVSGLLFKANLIMFNRGGSESLWPQMLAEARCGDEVGTSLDRYPVVEMTWEAWEALHPSTMAVTSDTGHDRDYQFYPYGNYDATSNSSFLGYPVPQLDSRRPPKERVIGVPPTPTESGMAFPFGTLQGLEGAVAVVEFTWEGEPAVVLWSDAARGGMVYRLRTDEGQAVELTADGGAITDVGTGSEWGVDGRAARGEMAGAALVPVASAYTAFWGSWAAFFPETEFWEG